MFDEKKENLNQEEETVAVSEEQKTENAAKAEAEARKPETAPAKKNKKKKMNLWLHSTRFQHGSMASVFVVGVLVLVILLNIGATALVNRFPSLRLDLTDDRRLSMNEDFIELVDQVTTKTEVTFCGTRETVEKNVNSILAQQIGGTAVNEGTRMLELMTKAAERNSNIEISFVDLEATPGFAAKYPNENLNTYSIVVQSPKRYKIMAVSDLYISNQATSGNESWYSNIEYALGNAMLTVNVDKLPVVAIATGHGETVPTVLQEKLTENNFEVQTVDLMLSQPIEDNVDVLIINAPTADYTEEQIKIVEDFLKNGEQYGKDVYVSLSPAQDTDSMPNFAAFMADWGIGVQKSGSVVVESDKSRYYMSGLYPILQFYTETETFLKDCMNKLPISYAVVPMETLWENHSGITVNQLLYTYDTAYAVAASEMQEHVPTQAEMQSYPVLTMSAKGVSGSKIVYSRVITCASSELLNGLASYASMANGDIAVSLFRFVTDTTGEENKVYVSPTELETSNFTMSSGTASLIGVTIFMIIIPLAVLAIGLIVWLRRRHL